MAWNMASLKENIKLKALQDKKPDKVHDSFAPRCLTIDHMHHCDIVGAKQHLAVC